MEYKVNDKEYTIIKMFGKGKGGYSYLAEKDGGQYVLKQIHHESFSYFSFGNKIESEQNDYKRLLNAGIRIPKMLEVDIDYFPINFVVQNGLIYYIDYECNEYMDEWNFENWGIKYWSKTLEFIEYVNKNS